MPETPLTQVKMEKKEKAMAARAASVPSLSGLSSGLDTCHWLARKQKPTNQRKAQKAVGEAVNKGVVRQGSQTRGEQGQMQGGRCTQEEREREKGGRERERGLSHTSLHSSLGDHKTHPEAWAEQMEAAVGVPPEPPI